MEELWNPIVGYEGLYEVSNAGQIRSIDRLVKHRNGGLAKRKGGSIAITKNVYGYMKCGLSKNGEAKTWLVHRLVAMAFIPNPNNLPEVNHINEITYDNRITNLEWCESSYNQKYGTRTKRSGKKHRKIICQLNMFGEVLAKYSSLSEVCKLFNYRKCHISRCANGYEATAYGYKWKYINL